VSALPAVTDLEAGPPHASLERLGDVAVVRFDRPAKRNAYTVRMSFELAACLREADADDAIRAVVLTGAGRDFCVGADVSGGAFNLKQHRGDPADPTYHLEPAGRVSHHLARMRKPVVAAWHGAAIGAGATIPLAADFRIASTDLRLAYPFTRLGIIPEGASHWYLPRLVGLPRATDWLLSGRPIHASEAMTSGVVSELHDAEELLDAAVALARRVTEGTAPVAVAVTRQLLARMSWTDDPGPVSELESRLIRPLLAGPDAREGVAARLERRAPEFRGRVSADLPHLPWM
jgi:enoyl-CoA hydratase/carnithine racemase